LETLFCGTFNYDAEGLLSHVQTSHSDHGDSVCWKNLSFTTARIQTKR
jgi:hypothetical protein